MLQCALKTGPCQYCYHQRIFQNCSSHLLRIQFLGCGVFRFPWASPDASGPLSLVSLTLSPEACGSANCTVTARWKEAFP